MNERTEVTTEIERRKTESEGAMSDVRERMRNILKSNKGNTGLTVVSVYLQTVKDAVAELEAQDRRVVRRDEIIVMLREELERLSSLADVKTGMSWMRSCDELTAECFRHKAEIERLTGEHADEAKLKEVLTTYHSDWWKNATGTTCELAQLALSRMSYKISSDAALIRAFKEERERLRNEIKRLERLTEGRERLLGISESEIAELKRDVQAAEREADRLQGEAERHLIEKAAACEDQRILRRILDDSGEKADRKEVALKDEIERLQADLARLMPLAVALGECDENDLPLAIVKAWREPSSYRRDELVRMSEKLAEAESLHSRAFRAARAEVERLTQSLADAEETALRRWNVANKQQMELERLRRELAESERVAQLGIRAIQERDELRGEAERLKSLDREIVSQRGAAQAALRQIAEMARCGLEYPVDAKGGTDET